MKSWFEFRAAAKRVEIFIYDDIGAYGTSAKAFLAELAKHKHKPLHLRINSPGGSVFDANAIYNALKNRGRVSAEIDGLAASAATQIALGCSPVKMAENALWMIHNASWTLSRGEKKDFQKGSEVLEKIDAALVAVYCAKTGKDEATIRAWMDAETWFTAKEAKEAGFIDEITSPVKATAAFDLRRFSNPPKALLEPLKGKALWDHYASLAPGERDEFLSLHEAALFEAAKEVDAGAATKAAPAAEDLGDARALWDHYESLTGAERTEFLDLHGEELAAAAALVDSAE